MKKIILITALLVSGCASKDTRYSLSQDITPRDVPSLKHIEDPYPRYETYSLAGNKDYSVLGKSYTVLNKPTAFTETGEASWYGKKFHGYRTSNGEIYDMFSMSAAHKTLPLPSYVEVENTANGKKVLVRVNDRGPFHGNRIIDLSYAAAAKLDMLNTGTGKVKITLLKPEKPQNIEEWQSARKKSYYVQLVAISDKRKAQQAAITFGKKLTLPTHVIKANDLYRVRLGPFYDFEQTQDAHMRAREQLVNSAFVVVEPIKY